jgi:hypothetical protein
LIIFLIVILQSYLKIRKSKPITTRWSVSCLITSFTHFVDLSKRIEL